jgi:hypothetical protein
MVAIGTMKKMLIGKSLANRSEIRILKNPKNY